jgi:hypothetical protein
MKGCKAADARTDVKNDFKIFSILKDLEQEIIS